MTEREALKLALDFISRLKFADAEPEPERVMEAIKEVLAQPEQEPFAFVDECGQMRRYTKQDFNQVEYGGLQRLYTTPPKRTWVGLTDDELNMIGDRMRTWNSHSLADVYIAIEAKLKEKNT